MEETNQQSTLQQVDELEEKIERLIGAFALQTGALSELRKKNEDLEEELRNRVESEKRYGEERTIIRSKVDSLLARLEGITDAA